MSSKETTYTFVWPANGENSLDFWNQNATFIAFSLDEAFARLMIKYDKRDWIPKLGDSVLVIVGSHHERFYARVVYAEVPLKLEVSK